MRHLTAKTSILAAASVLALGAASPALAGGMDYSHYSTVKQDGEQLSMSEDTVSAEALLRGDITNASGNLQGDITDIVLNDRGEATFIVYELSDAAATVDNTSFANFNSVDIWPEAGAMSAEVDLDMTAEPADQPNDRTITEAEANHQLVSRILDSKVRFHAGAESTIEDLLLTSDGKVEVAVIDTDGDANTPETLAVPFSSLTPGAEGWYYADESVTPDVLLFIG